MMQRIQIKLKNYIQLGLRERHFLLAPLITAGIGFLALHAPMVHAEEIPSLFMPPRALGMGGAFTAISSDDSAIWTNPAGIARIRKARSRHTVHTVRVPNLVAGINADGRAFYSGFSSAQSEKVEDIVTALGDIGDKPFWGRATSYPIIMMDVAKELPVAISIISDNQIKAHIQNDTPEVARIEAGADFGGSFSMAFTNRSNRFNVGIQVRPILRYSYEQRTASENLVDKQFMQQSMQDQANRTQGIGLDLGMMYTVADFWFPTIGMAVYNLPTGCKKDYLNPFTKKRETICGNLFRGTIRNQDAISVIDPTDVRVGFSITPRLSRKVALRLALDLHHLPIVSGDVTYGLQGIDASKLLHAGAELFIGNPLLPPPLAIRAGFGQGFISYGIGMNLGFMQLEFASYGRDISSTSSPLEDRRYIGSMTFEF